MQATLSQILAALSQQNPSQTIPPLANQPHGTQGFSPLPLSGTDGSATRFPFAPMDSPSSGQFSQFGMGGSSNARPSPASSGLQPGQPFYGNTLPPLGGNNQSMPFSPATNDIINQVVGQSSGFQSGTQAHYRPTEYGDGSNTTRYTPRRNNGVTFADHGGDSGTAYSRSPKAEPRWTSETDGRGDSPARKFPKFHGFAPPPHRYAQYGLMVASTAPSSEDESEDTLPRGTLDAPIEALQALANAADQAAQDEKAQQAGGNGFLSPPRVLQNRSKLKKRKRPEPTPR